MLRYSLVLLIIGLVIYLASCGSGGSNSSSVRVSFEEIETREFTEQELIWWTEVSNCLVNQGLANHSMISDVAHPVVTIAANTFTCGSTTDARGCGLEDQIILASSVIGIEVWFKHEACHVIDFWLNGRQDHISSYWLENKTCVCQ